MKNISLISSFLMLYSFNLMAQPLSAITYSVGEGLPQSQVFAMAQDSKGYLWFGTQGGGLGRFDGKIFQHFLPSEYVSSIIETQDKTLWVATNKGVFRSQFGIFELVQTTDNQTHKFTAFAETSTSKLLVGSEKGLWAWDSKVAQLYKISLQHELDRAIVQSFYKDEKGIWVATNRGVFCYRNDGTVSVIAAVSGIPIQSINKDLAGNYWCVSYNQGVFILQKNNLQLLQNIKSAALEKSLCSFAAPDGHIWIGTENKGIIQLSTKDTIQKSLSERDNLPSNHIRKIFQDSWNNIWIGTSGGGVTKLLAQNFIHFNTKNGLANDKIYALSDTRNGKIYCATGSNGIMSYNGTAFQKPVRDSLLGNLKVKALATDLSNRLWIGTENDGLFLMDSTCNRQFSTTEGLPSNAIKSIVVDTKNQVWAATQADGIVHITQKDAKTFVIENIKNGLPDLFISTLKLDLENRLWFATKNGALGYLQNGKVVKVFHQENGVLNTAIRSIAFGNQGFIFISTAGEGIFMADLRGSNPQFLSLKTPKAYAKNGYLLQFDNQNNLWSGSENGVEKFVFDAQHNVSSVEHFGKNEGFLGIETCQNAALCDQNGNLWFGTLNGLTKYFPTGTAQKTSVPKLHFEHVNLFYQPLEQTTFGAFALPSGGIKDGLSLPYHQNHIGFNFKGLYINSDEPMQYRWMLQGVETQWSPLCTQASVNYAKLEPGDYVFMVQASVDGIHFSETLSAPFSIQKPFWQTLWFRFIALMSCVLCIYFFIKYRENKIRAKANFEREQLETKNKLLTLEQKALQLQMNPHFIFNVLTSIQSLIVHQKTDAARELMSDFASLMRSILTNSRKAQISLYSEIETLETYLRIEQKSQKSDFLYTIHVAQSIDIEELMMPTMLLQPFVENALIHGIARFTQRGKIDISFDIQGEMLYCSIIDNGIGRTKSEELKGLTPQKHESAALVITAERLQALAASPTQKTLVISDVLSSDGTVTGTKVEVWIAVALF